MTSRLVGIVGAIASGKSTAARWFAAHGWVVVDADTQAHTLYSPGSELVERIARRFGPDVLADGGELDRAALGQIVFSDPAALSDLDALVHPLARERIRSSVDEALDQGRRVVLEMALLHRWPEMVGCCDMVLGIRCPDEIRLHRLQERSGLDPDEARRRILAQDQELLLSVATVSVSNAGTAADLEAWLGGRRW